MQYIDSKQICCVILALWGRCCVVCLKKCLCIKIVYDIVYMNIVYDVVYDVVYDIVYDVNMIPVGFCLKNNDCRC